MRKRPRRQNIFVLSLRFKNLGIAIIPVILLIFLVLLFGGEIKDVLFEGKLMSFGRVATLLDYPQNFGLSSSADPDFSSLSGAGNDGEMLPVMTVSLTPKSDEGYIRNGLVYIKNYTKLNIDLKEIMEKPLALKKAKKNEPSVLVIHTHGTESFSPEGAETYNTAVENRSTDINENVVAVGAEFVKTLEENGINAIHDKTMYDYPLYSGAYTRSGEAVKKYLKEYPSIAVVVDIHRDSIVTNEGVKYRPLATVGETNAAQVMFVVGTDQNGQEHKNWRDNLNFAAHWNELVEKSAPGLTRPMHLRRDRFNHHLTTGSVILEVGATGNSLSQAKESAKICAKTLSELLKNN